LAASKAPLNLCVQPAMTTENYLIPAIRAPLQASITLPGSKSIALRQLAIAALTQGQTKVRGIPDCDDTAAMLDCLIELGVDVTRDDHHLVLTGPMNFDRDVTLYARMSGASTRLLLGLAALRQGKTTLDGHPSLRARTNAPLLEVLARHGCQVEASDGRLPVTLKGPLRAPTRLEIDGALSSQYVTALLVIAPLLQALGNSQNALQEIAIKGTLVSRPYVDITLNEMAKRGVHARWQDTNTLIVEQGRYRPGEVTVEGDATAATYFAALATLHGGQVELTNLDATSKQGDFGFFGLMTTLGARIDHGKGSTVVHGPAQMRAFPATDMTHMPDAALTLITLAPLLPGGAELTGLSSLHHKECDRLECPAKELSALGVTVKTTHDSIRIEPSKHFAAATLNTYHDHRMAMAFSIP